MLHHTTHPVQLSPLHSVGTVWGRNKYRYDDQGAGWTKHLRFSTLIWHLRLNFTLAKRTKWCCTDFCISSVKENHQGIYCIERDFTAALHGDSVFACIHTCLWHLLSLHTVGLSVKKKKNKKARKPNWSEEEKMALVEEYNTIIERIEYIWSSNNSKLNHECRLKLQWKFIIN